MVVFHTAAANSNPIGVNSRRVLYVSPTNTKLKFGKKGAWIHMNDGTDLYVIEACDDVVKRIDKDRRKG